MRAGGSVMVIENKFAGLNAENGSYLDLAVPLAISGKGGEIV